MANIPWDEIRSAGATRRRPGGPTVRFFNAYRQNPTKTREMGRPMYDEIPSISLKFAGRDETVRAITIDDQREYPELYKAFKAGSEPIEAGTPLKEWPMLAGSAMLELQHFGFRTVEQLAETPDDIKRRMGTLAVYVKRAQDWLDAANSPQNEIVALRESLESERQRTKKLEETLNLLIQRIDSTEGNDMFSKTVVADTAVDSERIEPKKRGRPRVNIE